MNTLPTAIHHTNSWGLTFSEHFNLQGTFLNNLQKARRCSLPKRWILAKLGWWWAVVLQLYRDGISLGRCLEVTIAVKEECLSYRYYGL